MRDHPRVCGEKSPDSSCSISRTGSPPRMRGKARMILIHVNGERITPAYAGKSPSGIFSCAQLSDHPRVCGEKTIGLVRMTTPIGSPPRMRGKAAGSSGDYSTAGDHPRVCGEKIWLSSVCVHASGSPPRMRGKVYSLISGL